MSKLFRYFEHLSAEFGKKWGKQSREDTFFYENTQFETSFILRILFKLLIGRFTLTLAYTVKKISHGLKHVKTNLRFFGLS